MVSCQEPSPLKGSKHSLQCHPHDAALVNAQSFVSMGVEARYCPCHSAAHCRHMKRQPSLCHCCTCRGHHHCNHHCHLRCHCQLCCHRHHRCHCHCHCHCRQPLPLPSPSAIAILVAVAHCCRHLCPIAVSHRRVALAIGHCHHCHCWSLQSPSLLAITVAVTVGHCRELLPWRSKNCIGTI